MIEPEKVKEICTIAVYLLDFEDKTVLTLYDKKGNLMLDKDYKGDMGAIIIDSINILTMKKKEIEVFDKSRK